MIANRNELWGRVVAEELSRCGIREVCVSPGSRSTPLVLGVHGEPELRVTTHLDERSGGYFALGAAKATGNPVALICTSGTAAANFFPAVVEASMAGVPLVLLTADRPPELRGTGANQTIDQDHLYGRYPRLFADAGLPDATPERARELRALVCRAVAMSRSPFPGPVHLNFPFREPLEPTPVPGDLPGDWSRGDRLAAEGRGREPFVELAPGFPHPEEAALDAAARRLDAARRPLLVAGPGAAAPEILQLAKRIAAPVFCDPLSGLRYGPDLGAVRISAYDAWLAPPDARAALAPDLVLRFGALPTSKSLLAALEAWGLAAQIQVDDSARRAEPTRRASVVLPGRPGPVAEAFAARVAPRDYAPAAQLAQRLDEETKRLHEQELPRRDFEGAAVRRLADALGPGAVLWIGSSLPVRDLDRFVPARDAPLHVLANRGASGIDGVVSSALGAAHATGRRVVLVVGDLSFLHDLSGVLSGRRLGLAADVVVFDNGGGGIFEFLPIARHEPPFTELFVTPHGADLSRIAEAAGWRVASGTPAQAAEQLAAAAGGPRLFHVPTDRKANVRHRRELESLLGARLATVLEEDSRAR